MHRDRLQVVFREDVINRPTRIALEPQHQMTGT